MRQPSGIPRVKSLIVAFFLLALAANEARAQEIELWGYGPALKKPNVQAALMQAIDWAYLTGSVFGDPDLPVVLYPPEQDEWLDNYNWPFDPKNAQNLLDTSEDFEIVLLYNYEPGVAQFAGGIVDSLWELGIEATTLETATLDELEEAEGFLTSDTDAAGVNALVMWFVR